MTSPHILIVSPGPAAEVAEVVKAAAGAVFSQDTVDVVANVDAALLHAPRRQTVLLVLVEPHMDEVKLAVEAVDLQGLPRWAFVILGGEVTHGGAEVVPREEWSLPLLRHVLRAAVDQFELARENARFRGDLHTIGRRISHDLRTPLSGIFTTTELLQEVMTESCPNDVDLLKPLYDSAQAELRLIDRVSFLLKATVEPKPKAPVEMDKIVWEARQPVERLIMQKGAQVTEAETWTEVQGVEAWLQVIWGNLLANAVMHGGRSIHMGWTPAEGEIAFWVKDNGPGVPAERRPLMFQPFHRLHQRGSIHGLGLAIVQRLVELQGGRCGYESEAAAGGSQFYFTLPLG
jgi:signal transduction histidine kinase